MADEERTAQEGLDLLLAYAYQEVGKELQDAAMDVAGKGALEAPVKKGFLRASVQAVTDVKIAQVKGSLELSTQVVARMPYAFVQHEHSEFKHPKGGKDHYLTDPLKADEPMIIENVAKAASRALRRAGVK